MKSLDCKIKKPFLASSSHCFVMRRYLGDSGHIGRSISCNIAGQIAKPAIKIIQKSLFNLKKTI